MKLTKAQALALAATKWWEHSTAKEIASFQLQTPKLCMPFGIFHEAVEKALGRPVYTHEFANMGDLLMELLGESQPPTLQQILDKIPAEKRIVIAPADDKKGD